MVDKWFETHFEMTLEEYHYRRVINICYYCSELKSGSIQIEQTAEQRAKLVQDTL